MSYAIKLGVRDERLAEYQRSLALFERCVDTVESISDSYATAIDSGDLDAAGEVGDLVEQAQAITSIASDRADRARLAFIDARDALLT